MSQQTSFTRHPGRRLQGRVEGLFRSRGEDFITRPVETLDLTFHGIEGDRHGGPTRLSGGREPWYPRQTEMRNERQLSILSPDELAETAQALAIDRLAPEWIGANLVVSGITRLSWLPPRTLLFFAGGVTLKVDGDNAPCKIAGRAIAAQHPRREDIATGFVQAARHRRGLVAWVEKPGRIGTGEVFEARLPEQWIYEPA